MRVLAHRISRRRMIAASGAALGAPLALAACGQTNDADDDRSEDADPDLLNAILGQHLAVSQLSGEIDSAIDPGLDVITTLKEQRKDSVTELEAFIAERDGERVEEPAEPAEAESPAEALSAQLEDSIAATLDVIGELSSPAYRQAAHRYVTEDAAALAALRSITGGEVAPEAFVLGTAAEGS